MGINDHPPLTATAMSTPTPTEKMDDAESLFPLRGSAIRAPHSPEKQPLAHHNNTHYVHPILDTPNTKQITITTIIIRIILLIIIIIIIKTKRTILRIR